MASTDAHTHTHPLSVPHNRSDANVHNLMFVFDFTIACTNSLTNAINLTRFLVSPDREGEEQKEKPTYTYTHRNTCHRTLSYAHSLIALNEKRSYVFFL